MPQYILSERLDAGPVICAECFGSLSSVYEHVSAACGVTPREYRRQGR